LSEKNHKGTILQTGNLVNQQDTELETGKGRFKSIQRMVREKSHETVVLSPVKSQSKKKDEKSESRPARENNKQPCGLAPSNKS